MSEKRIERVNAISECFQKLGLKDESIQGVIRRACHENAWFTEEHCTLALRSWKDVLSADQLTFALNYAEPAALKNIGVIMAGNLPLVGLHDLLMVLISGHKAVVKLSSDDKSLMGLIVQLLKQHSALSESIEVVDNLPKGVDAVIATGSNNSYRYFEYYFRDIPHVLRKNRRSMAVLDGTETEEDLQLLASDSLHYFGLGCRNVSLLLLHESMDIVKVIDAFEGFSHFKDHNKHHNNYTYHKALFLMNQEEHLDNGFLLFKKDKSLHAPLGTLYYAYYSNEEELSDFIASEKDNLQCVVGKNSMHCDVAFGKSQFPEIQDFADKVDTLKFLTEL